MKKSHKPTIKCETVGCFCPHASDGSTYTFEYVDHQKKIIYYDVPKTGSTTIRSSLFPEAWPTGEAPCVNSIQNSRDNYEDYFTFTFVRNPWSRMISTWKHFASKDFHIKQLISSGIDISNLKNFKSFLYMTLCHDNHHWQPQHMFMPFDVDFIGRTETFQQDFNIVCDKIGIPKQQLPHKNRSKHKHYTEYYDDETREIVAERYARDIEYFGYDFGG